MASPRNPPRDASRSWRARGSGDPCRAYMVSPVLLRMGQGDYLLSVPASRGLPTPTTPGFFPESSTRKTPPNIHARTLYPRTRVPKVTTNHSSPTLTNPTYTGPKRIQMAGDPHEGRSSYTPLTKAVHLSKSEHRHRHSKHQQLHARHKTTEI